MRIGIDLLGSDTPPADLFPAVVKFVEQIKKPYVLVVFIHEAHVRKLNDHLPHSLKSPAKVEIFPVTEYISMAEDPLLAIKAKKNSSLVIGLRLIKKNQLDAFITAGNTGALIACATLTLNKLPGITRPALLAVMPTKINPLTVIDVGGTVTCKASHLVQYAQLGAIYHCCRHSQPLARVGLLNVGVESKKGTSQLRQTFRLLEECKANLTSNMQFIGNVEARDLFKGHFDVLVTDGFTGNIVLKTAEGVSSFVLESLKLQFNQLKSEGALNELFSFFNYTEYPGAIVCGVDGLLIKCHGNPTPVSLFHAIETAIDLSEKHLILQMKKFF